MVKHYVAIVLFLWVLTAESSDAVLPNAVELKPVESRTAPAIILSRPDKQSYELKDYGGVVTLVHFWASWCEPCLRELPELQELNDRYRGKGLNIIAVAEDSHNAVNSFMSGRTVRLNVMVDQYGSGLRAYKVKALPSTFLVDESGRIGYSATGPVRWGDKEALQILNKLLGAK